VTPELSEQQWSDDLAFGRLTQPEVQFQRDTGGRYEDLPGETNDAASTLPYLKVQGLEHDELYRPLLQHPVFREVAVRHYRPHASVSLFRVMIMNKPAGQGTALPWLELADSSCADCGALQVRRRQSPATTKTGVT
jgi:hypothetical protein